MKQKNTNSLRKIFAGLCMFCVLIVICFQTISVNAKGNAKLTASTCTVDRGETATITLRLEENPGIWGMKFWVGYDNSVLTLTSVTNGEVFSESEVTPPETLNKETYVYLASADRLEDILVNGTVVTLKFKVSKDAEFQSYPVAVEITQAVNIHGEEIEISAINGSVDVEWGEQGQQNVPSGQNVALANQESVRTGDNSNMTVWLAFTVAGAGVAVVFGSTGRKRRNREVWK